MRRKLKQNVDVVDGAARPADPDAAWNIDRDGDTIADARAAIAERDAVGFSYDAQAGVVTVCGTKFSRDVLENFQTTTPAGQCYRHERRENGVVILWREPSAREFADKLIAKLAKLLAWSGTDETSIRNYLKEEGILT